MKTKFLRIGKSSLSVLLSIMMIVSTMFIGTIGTLEASAASSGLKIAGSSDISLAVGGANLNWEKAMKDITINISGTDIYYIDLNLTEKSEFKLVGNNGSTWYGARWGESQYTSINSRIYIDNSNDGPNVQFKCEAGLYRLCVRTTDNVAWIQKINSVNDPFEMDYFIQGRFRIKKSVDDAQYINTYDGDGNGSLWEENSTKIRFEKAEDGNYYKLDTNCTLNELSVKLGLSGWSEYQYFWIKDANNVLYQPNNNTELKDQDAGTEYELKNSGGMFYFNSNIEDGTVVLYFDPDTNKFWYEMKQAGKYTNTAEFNESYGSVYVNPEEAAEGTTILVNVFPNSGYVISQVTITYDAGQGQVIIQPTRITDSSYSYQMPAADVTVNVEFVQPDNDNDVMVKVKDGQENCGVVQPEGNQTVQVGSSITLNATPFYGYKFETWEFDNDNYEIQGSVDLTSSSITIYPKSDLTATAVFSELPQEDYYIEGRFRLRKTSGGSWIYTKNSGDYYANDSKNLQFEHVDGTTTYKLETYATYDELKSQINGNASKFYIRKAVGGTLDEAYYPTADGDYWLTTGSASDGITNKVKLNTATSGSTISVHLWFQGNASNTAGPVTLWFDSSTKEFWFTILPNTLTVIAKDGTVRNNGTGEVYEKYPKMADTTIKYTNGSSIGYDYSKNPDTNEYRARKADNVQRYSSITVTTTIKPEYRGTYYVKAFSINGDSYGIISKQDAESHKSDGVYTCEFTITDELTTIEITPVYFYFDDTNTIDFIVENFDQVQAEWGSTISCFAWYYGLNKTDTWKNASGGYPGQPMIYEGGIYYMQVPRECEGGAIQGITLNGYIWDDIHAEVLGVNMNASDPSVERSEKNAQTYDYDDFVALARIPDVDTITFRFKYRTEYDNKGNGNITNTYTDSKNWSEYTQSSLNYSKYELANGGNGWATFVNYNDEPVDLFVNKLNSSNTTSEHYYIVSSGYENTYMGKYSTLWYIYDKNFNFVGVMPPSARYYIFSVNEYWDKDHKIFTYPESLPEKRPDNFIPDEDMYETDDLKNSETDAMRNAQRDYFWKTLQTLYNNGARGAVATITYETSIRRDKSTGISQPAYRCDGRWYYSRQNEPVSANILIEYKNAGGMFVRDTYVVDDEGNATNKGVVTGASAYFTNEGDYKYLTQSTEEPVNPDNAFTFTADAVGNEDAENTTKYVFVGWYIIKDGNYNPVNNANNLTNVNGSVAMTAGNKTLIARYVPDQSLTISHRLYSQATNKTADAPAVHNGTGKTYITVKLTPPGGSSLDTYTYGDASSSSISIPTDVLAIAKANNYAVEITLRTIPNDNYTDMKVLYLREDISSTEAKYHPSTEKYENWQVTDTNSKTSDKYDHKSEYKFVYKCSIADLYNNDNLKSDRIRFYSDLVTSKISVKFKYYDRDVNAYVPSIKETSTIVSVKTDLTSSIENAITSSVFFKSEGDAQVARLTNVLDEYIIWASQAEAVAGIKAENYYGAKYKAAGSAESGMISRTSWYKYSDKFSEAELAYHTNCYGEPIKSGEKWVTYFDSSNTEIKDEEANITSDPKRVSSVTVWVYNAPKMYTVEVYNPQNAADDLDTGSGDSGVFFANSSLLYSGFFNQRLGLPDVESGDHIEAGSNDNNPYLKNCGITSAYFGNINGVKVEAKGTLTHNDKRYKFDGWYVDGVKVSTQRNYENRITNNMHLKAGYVLDDAKQKTDMGVSVTENSRDIYIDTDGTQKIRFNTMLNVYNSQDMNENIEQVSVYYIILPKNDTVGQAIDWKNTKITNLEDIRIDIKNRLSNTASQDINVKLSENRTATATIVRNYNYDVEGSTLEKAVNATKVTLTSKNRLQFTLSMSVKAFEENYSAFLTFGAINYNNDEAKDWIVSDNCISYIN